ncbi:hypothetical protein AN639_05400 [Candidatus Epulonipiscium fishelsonii]|uniref:Uncharacterized protein n=1 Tax=Candidatus Epulonipiscium fishelsonii TaxID=77094 RepID=A0ACC8XAK1_9FIRM|nr:hypothetical protein AN396_08295 [Epulopiscium sp. SCG-B11WGA-EpuloA1]ONI40140.1 hypothetical protein AN639_05400 [Epulopiscium sp. SCG-B05WGA-EpuloA1]ONI48000.1 hypothetical protein AN644_03040 [Epulopiscium sp. SCG-C06WGA-EpuloA1]
MLKIEYISTDKITINPYQPRKIFIQEELESLANLISVYGIIEPIVVRLVGNLYEIIIGERRFKASQILKMEEVPAIVVPFSDKNSATFPLSKNLHSKRINYFEESEAMHNLIDDFGYTLEELSKYLGKSQSYIMNKLKLKNLPEQVKNIVLENNLPETYVQEILKLPAEYYQMEALQEIILNQYNINQTQKLIVDIIERIIQKEARERIKFKITRKINDGYKLAVNTLMQSVELIKQSNIDVEYVVDEQDETYEIKIKILKN